MACDVKTVYEGRLSASGLSFGIVCSRFNELFTSKLLGGAIDCLVRHDASADAIEVAWVPGSFEIPLVAERLAASGRYDAVTSELNTGVARLDLSGFSAQAVLTFKF